MYNLLRVFIIADILLAIYVFSNIIINNQEIEAQKYLIIKNKLENIKNIESEKTKSIVNKAFHDNKVIHKEYEEIIESINEDKKHNVIKEIKNEKKSKI